MTAPLFITTEKRTTSLPLLIVDKPARFSKGLISMLAEHFPVVLVSERHFLPHLHRVTHVSFRRAIPAIPDDYFSAIVLFYHGEKALADALPAFIKKAKQNNAKLLFITSREYADAVFLAHGAASYGGMHVLLYSDVFGVSPHEESVVSAMAHEAYRKHTITVHGSGLSESNPVYYPDMLQGILEVLLSQHPPKTGLLYPVQSVPEIHVARLMKKLFPHAEILFTDHHREDPPPLHRSGVGLIEEPYPLEEKLKHLRVGELNPAGRSRHHRSRGQRKRLFKAAPFVVAGVGIVGVFLSLTFIFFLFGLLSLQVTMTAAKKGDLALAKKRAQTARELFKVSGVSAVGISVLAQPLRLGGAASEYERLIQTGRTASDVLYYVVDAGLAYEPLPKGESLNPKQDFLTITTDVKQALLGLAQLRSMNAVPQEYRDELRSLEQPLRQLSGIVESLPQFVGVGKEQTYLVLFQNNMELRPGGGFIGSYGLLTLKDGRMQSFTIHDVYDADGQLTGHVDPPHGLKRYLGAAHWYLRDSNFSVEFAQNSAQAASFLQLSTGEQVDGVIAVDVSFLRTLLTRTGPVYLPAYDETVSAKNFYLSAQTHAEKDFFPGSSQKKDYLHHVAQAVLLSLEEQENLPVVPLVRTVLDAVAQKHLMIASADSRLMTLLTKNDFAPTVTISKAEAAAAVSDFVGFFDANVGANKANYYVKRSTEHSVLVSSSGEVKGNLAVSYTHGGAPNSPFGGDYQNYAQVVLPERGVITDILIDDAEQEIVLPVTSERVYRAERFVPPKGIELDRQVLHGRSVYGFFFTVPTGKTKIVTVRYTTPAPDALPERFTYSHRVYKQPGTDYDPYRLILTYDASLRLIEKPSFVSHVGRTLQVTQELAEDITAQFVFTK
jgi:hypothetical protein